MDRFDTQLRSRLAAPALPATEAAAIADAVCANGGARVGGVAVPACRGRRLRIGALLVAASLLVASTLVTVHLTAPSPSSKQANGHIDIATRVTFASTDALSPLLREVTGHIAGYFRAREPLAIETSDWDTLQAELSDLDFQMVAPREIRERTDLRLVGARYCTLCEAIAVEIVFERTDGVLISLFQTRDRAALSEILDGTTVTFEDLQVALWREDGVFVGLGQLHA